MKRATKSRKTLKSSARRRLEIRSAKNAADLAASSRRMPKRELAQLVEPVVTKLVATQLRRLEKQVSEIRTALEFTLADVDPDRPGDFDLLEARRRRTAHELLRREMLVLKSRGVIDDAGERVKAELPPDMR